MRKNALGRLTPYVSRHKFLLLGAILLAFVEVAAEAQIPLITGRIIDGPILRGERGTLWPLIGLLAALGLFETTLAFIRRNLLARASYRVETAIRNDLYHHLQRLHVGFHDGWQSGQLLSRAIQDINSIRRFVGFGLPFLVILSFQLVWILWRMYGVNQTLAIMSIITILPVGYISYRFGKKYRVISRKVQDEQGDLSTLIEEAATGIRIIKAFGRGPKMRERFRKQAESFHESNMGWVRLAARLWPTFDIFPNLAKLLILLVGGLMHLRGGLSIGDLVALLSYVSMLIWPVDALGWILAMTEESRTATERIFEVFDTRSDIADRPGAESLESSVGRIEFEKVHFQYEQNRDWVLRGVDLEVLPGETMAIVGKTGSGKTTLAMLVPRLYDAVEGSVKIDGREVRDLTLSSLRRQIGVAFEDPILFSASVRENLIMGRPDSTDDEIKEALETAQAEFVNELPWGLETRVGEQGHTLSGGQRQRLALARAVLGRPQILILDDPLSSVDVHTEALIEEALRSVLSGVTAILVAHRPSTILLADRVALLDEGRIVAVGTHRQLMESEPMYRSILSQEAEEFSDV